MPKTSPPLSSVLPPLIFGTATFNYQYSTDPFNLPTTALVHKALSVGVRAFDTSPYYGPAEEILGHALKAPFEATGSPYPRADYYIVTKVGRINTNTFDYSAAWVRKSIQRSLERMHTSYLDVVYCHDVEFVTPSEVLTAVRELRRLRDEEKTIRYIGISGYPVDILCELAELVLRETGEPLDCVMNYCNYSLQNQRLASEGLPRLIRAGVDVVPNASILSMGLLRQVGVPKGSMGDWHPSPDGLREAVHEASLWLADQGEKIEVVAIRWALESWLTVGKHVGGRGDPRTGLPLAHSRTGSRAENPQLGVSVMGVSKLEELDETLRVWQSILDGYGGGSETTQTVQVSEGYEWSLKRREHIATLTEKVWEILGEWRNFAWASPDVDFVRGRVEDEN